MQSAGAAHDAAAHMYAADTLAVALHAQTQDQALPYACPAMLLPNNSGASMACHNPSVLAARGSAHFTQRPSHTPSGALLEHRCRPRFVVVCFGEEAARLHARGKGGGVTHRHTSRGRGEGAHIGTRLTSSRLQEPVAAGSPHLAACAACVLRARPAKPCWHHGRHRRWRSCPPATTTPLRRLACEKHTRARTAPPIQAACRSVPSGM